jgi:hypothetical protein
MRCARIMVLATLFTLTSSNVLAAGDFAPISIYVSQTGDDPVGSALAYSVKEEIRRSSAFSLSATDNSVAKILFVTLDPDPSTPGGIRTAYSFTLLVKLVKGDGWRFITSNVGVCPRNYTKTCAETIVAAVDKSVTQLEERMPPQ